MKGVHPIERVFMNDVQRHTLCMWPNNWQTMTPPWPQWVHRLVRLGWLVPGGGSCSMGAFPSENYVHCVVSARGLRALDLDSLVRSLRP